MEDAASYTIQISTDQSFREPLVSQAVRGPRFEIDLLEVRPLWWRVSALDARGVWSPWSIVRRLEIVPPPLALSVFAVSVNPSNLAGGEEAEGLVTLENPAPTAGATVPLASSDPRHAVVPPRVMFASGSRAATFRITTRPVPDDVPVRITAGSERASKIATLTVVSPRPPGRLLSLALVPAILAAGESGSGTVTLATRAPRATTIRLASADPSRVKVPAAVTIRPGATAATFSFQTAHDTTPGTVAVTASGEDGAKTASLTLRGAASMQALRAPSPIVPLEEAVVVYNRPIEFAWSDVFGAVSYTIEVDAAGSFAGPLAASRTVPATRLIITPLPRGTLWWRVRANDENGAPGRWSPPRSLEAR